MTGGGTRQSGDKVYIPVAGRPKREIPEGGRWDLGREIEECACRACVLEARRSRLGRPSQAWPRWAS